jgi:hypothetical protein
MPGHERSVPLFYPQHKNTMLETVPRLVHYAGLCRRRGTGRCGAMRDFAAEGDHAAAAPAGAKPWK